MAHMQAAPACGDAMMGTLQTLADIWWMPWLLMGVGSALIVVGGGWWWAGRQLQRSLADAVEHRTRRLEDVSRRFRLMADNAYDLIAISDADGRMEYMNAAFTRVLGFGKEELRDVRLPAWVHPKNREEIAEILRRVVAEGGTLEASVKLPHVGGSWVDVELVAKGLPDSDWVVRSVVLHARDISQRKKMLDELARNEQRFKDFAGSSADWLWETDVAGIFRYVSPGVTNVLGYDPEELTGQNQLNVLYANEEDNGRELVQNRVERRQPYRELEFWTKSKNGDRVCLRLSGIPVFDAQQEFTGYRGAASNVTASKVEREHVFRLATTDHLTGLLNGARFKEELERAVVLARRHGTSGVVLFIDLDRFKEVNDTHGHQAGDQILLGVAEILRDSVRSTDIVARRGGDEFSIIMHNIDVESAAQKVQRMIERIKAFGIEYNGTRLTVTMSVGMVQYPQDEKGADHLIMSADLAMYRAKDMGRNRLFVDASDAGSETVGSVRAQLKWVDRLRYCLEHDEFQMHYQAIVPTHKKKRPLFEALLRIYDEHGKVASPALYIDAAEHFGLIQQLDLAVVRRVFITQKALIDEGVAVDVSINLSSRTLGDPAVVPKLRQLMVDYSIDPTRIIFEVTETMALHDPAQMRDIDEIRTFINSLREMGFRFALDDFGTGFTSFRYLKVLDVDIVKIDGEYVKDIVNDADDRLFVKSMVQLCDGLGIETIAEFVETKEVMELLKELGVGAGQGWLFAKPMPDLKQLAADYTGKSMDDFGEEPPLLKVAKKGKVSRDPKAKADEATDAETPAAGAKKAAKTAKEANA
ncbi:MAG: bifunctional diguanylate cyclase/phosphodiesterase [Alphaproteobacteria bacterium]|nr:MAG: bifunctional diguanylate cyclase/phosphodiesterase [Alphaproteobacteria bacterium]